MYQQAEQSISNYGLANDNTRPRLVDERRSSMDGAMERIATSAGKLGGLISDLHKRLEPVLRCETPQPASNETGRDTPPDACPIATNLDAMAALLREQYARLTRILNHLDI